MIKKSIPLLVSIMAFLVIMYPIAVPVSAMTAPEHRYAVCPMNHGDGEEGRIVRHYGSLDWSKAGAQYRCRHYGYGADIKEKRIPGNHQAVYYSCNKCHSVTHIVGEAETKWICAGFDREPSKTADANHSSALTNK